MKKNLLIIIYALFGIMLLLVIIQLPYTIHYNIGNRLYNSGDYADAVMEYQKALSLFPPKYKECSIRINLVLAMLKQNYAFYTDSAKIGLLESAKNILTEDGCANRDDDNGHSDEAERLKKDIDRELEKLKRESGSGSSDDDNNEDDNSNDEKNDDDNENEVEIKEKLNILKDKQEQSLEERQSYLDYINSLAGYTFYSGKNW